MFAESNPQEKELISQELVKHAKTQVSSITSMYLVLLPQLCAKIRKNVLAINVFLVVANIRIVPLIGSFATLFQTNVWIDVLS